MGVILKLDNVRLSFPKLDEPDYFKPGVKSRPGEERRWGAAFHILANDPQKARIDAALKQVATEKWAAKASTMLANILPDPKGCCFQDGARKEVEGAWILNAYRYESKGRPIIIDSDLSPLYLPIDEQHNGQNGKPYIASNVLAPGKAGRLYSGCFVNGKVEFWAQDNANGKALRATLMVIQRFKDGDAFGGGAPTTADDFAEIADGADADDLT